MEKRNRFIAKGFLFTISVIFFSATLVFFAQAFATKNLAEQTDILASIKLFSAPMVADDIMSDIKELTSFSASTAFSDGNLMVSLSDTIQKGNNFEGKLRNYQTFLDTNYFPHLLGTESINLQGAEDGNYDVNIGTVLVYSNNYANTEATLIDTTGTGLKSIDLNVFVEGDLNSYTWAPASGGTVPVMIRFFGDHNYVEFFENIDPTSESLLSLWHDNNALDKTIISIGPVAGSNSSFRIDSNSINKVSFSLDANYSGYTSSQPVDMNILLTTTNGSLSSSSLVRLWK